MVLLTMTPAMVATIKEFWPIISSSENLRHMILESEPRLDNPAVGKPISYAQVLEVFTLIRQHRSVSEPDSENADVGSEFPFDELLRGSKVYVPPPPPRAESVSGLWKWSQRYGLV